MAAMNGPLDALINWPLDRPLVMLHSGRYHERWSRRSILAEPGAIVRGDRWDPDIEPFALRCGGNGHAARGWIGMLSYELGASIEPACGVPHATEWPAYYFTRAENPVVFDLSAPALNEPSSTGQHRDEPTVPKAWELSPLEPAFSAEQYLATVERTIEYIRAGDLFQANITQPFRGRFRGRPRELALAAFATAQPWYGAYLELEDGRVVLSLSPELFLDVEASSGAIVTRPIKGTRPVNPGGADEHRALQESLKDEAELNMIVDLMRNDLGRVCRIGSVRVPQPRAIETHPTVHHGVATVTGSLRQGVTVGDVLAATFPPGSVTGAPKIRAMQVIRELETCGRGPYCGAIGWMGDDGGMTLNVAIRTMLLTPRGGDLWDVTYSVGGGIVVDSTPERELQECHEKAAVIQLIRRRAASQGTGFAAHPR